MKTKQMIVIMLVGLWSTLANAQNLERYTVYKSNTEGYKSFRIPALIKTKKGELLAFAEGRVDGLDDYGHIKIVVKKSKDNGKTWSPVTVVASYKNMQAGNPAPVIDYSDPNYPQGRVFLFYNTGNDLEMKMRKGEGHRNVLYVTSTDDGDTWSEPTDITSQVNLLNKPQLNPEWNHKEDWRTYANTPGHAFQFEKGKYKGRIYIAANHSAGNPRPELRDYQAHGFYTDDHGKSFKLSNSVPFDGSNESTACQIGTKGVILNSRNQTGKYRVVSFSNDGGVTWKQTYVDQQLPDPICQGSILNIGKKGGKDILAFVNAASKTSRDSLTLKISFDAGRNWSYSKLISPTPSVSKDAAAYSDVVKINDKNLGILYEADFYSSIVYVPVRWRD